jgi:uncharacterized cupin superfamily protein
MPVPEDPMEDREHGRRAAGGGWFVLNLADSNGMGGDRVGTFSAFESPSHPQPHFGIGVHILWPGQPNGLYHEEDNQEDFLVLSGECILLVEEQERRMRQWDFFHSPPNTRHIFVGAGDGPCAILMAGARRPDEKIHYPVSELAARYGASAVEPTDNPREAYPAAGFDRTVERPFPWPPTQQQP